MGVGKGLAVCVSVGSRGGRGRAGTTPNAVAWRHGGTAGIAALRHHAIAAHLGLKVAVAVRHVPDREGSERPEAQPPLFLEVGVLDDGDEGDDAVDVVGDDRLYLVAVVRE